MCALVACRMCLAVGKRMRSIAGTPLEDFYEKITNIQLENKYGKPVLGCNVCLHLLKKCQTFIEDVGRADETLTRICGAGSEISEQSRLLAEVAKPRASLGLSGVKCAWYDPRQPPDCKVKIEVEIESDYSSGNTATSAVASTSDSMALKAPGSAELCKIKIEPEEVEEPPEDDTDPVDERYRSDPQPPLHALSPDCILGATPEWRAEAQPSGRGKSVSIGKRSKSNEALKKPETKRFKPPLSKEVICINDNNYSEPDTAPRTPERFAVDKNNLLEYRKEISYYECSYCNKAFSKKSILTSHIRTHTGEKPYQCSHCGKAFSQKSHLTIHIRTHTGEKPHQCSHCSKAFSEKRNLTSHIRTHTGEKPYQCSHCSKAFSYKCNLTNHIRTHTGAKQYRCSHCSKAFMHNSSLTKHVRTHHRRSVGESSGCPTSPPPLT